MNDYIFDDKPEESLNPTFDMQPHALSGSYGHISIKIMNDINCEYNLEQRKMLIKVYVDYLLQSDTQVVYEIVTNYLLNHPSDHEIIYKPAHLASYLALYSTLSLKFKRKPNDGLT